MNQCVILDDATDWQARAEQAEAFALTLQAQRDAAEAETAQALEALTIAHAELTVARAELEAAQAVVKLWRNQPDYYDDCDPGQNDPYYAWYAEMNRLVAAYHAALAPLEQTP